jgi:predicted NAD/FAD-dependent oxidoreductase
MSAMVGHMADSHDVTFGSIIKGLVRDAAGWRFISDQGMLGPFDTAVVAIPAEQAAALLLLHDPAMARVALGAVSEPCWTAMFAFDGAIDTPAPFFREGGIIGWAARNSAKPGRSGVESWVVQASAPWSSAHVEDSAETIAPQLLDALAERIGHALPAPVFARAHRWRYARSAAMGQAALWNDDLLLGACGDWLLGPRVECAWLSGTAVAQRVLNA